MINHTTQQALWAKKPKDDEPSEIVPLRVHLQATANVAKKLWETWLPKGLQAQLDKPLLVFLAYAHDIGKASPVFQLKEGFNTLQTDNKIRDDLERAGFPLKTYREPTRTPHALVSHGILKRNGFDDSVCVIAGGHHGAPPNTGQLKNLRVYEDNCGFDEDIWVQAQDALLNEALAASGLSKDNINIPRPRQVLYSGLIILADWMASGNQAVEDMPAMWAPRILQDIYNHRFKIKTPRPVQSTLVDAVKQAHLPGVFIVEAPMGEGKTEAALAAAEILASKVGCRGVYFALPSQATSNAMLTRVKNWIGSFSGQDGALSIRLAHGKADLNEEYEGIKLDSYNSDERDGDSKVTVHDWLVGRKKGILADFTIGTIDHVLMAGLQQKHLALRHLGLASKVLIIDECHAYDVYMESYLLTALKWLGAYGVPVIILSATLPTERRKDIIEAYLSKTKRRPHRAGAKPDNDNTWATSLAYPLITYTDNKNIISAPIEGQASKRTKEVQIKTLDDENLIPALDAALENGGCAGVIFNTVKKAQEAYKEIAARFGNDTVELLHSGFIATDRATREKELLQKLGKAAKSEEELLSTSDKTATLRPKKRVVVGTQVFEQSLDIDFDVMFTQLCPIDLLLQRIGRLHRHDRVARPSGVSIPKCYVLGTNWDSFDGGSKAVYGEYLLMRTCAVLEKWGERFRLPDDIPQLVAQVYNSDVEITPPEGHIENYNAARETHERESATRKRRAEGYQIKGSIREDNIIGWLETSYRDSEGEAAVRDGTDGVEVLLVQRRSGELCLLQWVQGGKPLPHHFTCEKLAKAVAGCSVRLPRVFSYDISATISSIEDDMLKAGIVDSWYESYWLKGALVLILDDEQKAVVNGRTVHYDRHMGLQVV